MTLFDLKLSTAYHSMSLLMVSTKSLALTDLSRMVEKRINQVLWVLCCAFIFRMKHSPGQSHTSLLQFDKIRIFLWRWTHEGFKDLHSHYIGSEVSYDTHWILRLSRGITRTTPGP